MATAEDSLKKPSAWPYLGGALSVVAKLVAAGVLAYGVAQYRAGGDERRLETVERDVREAKGEHEKFVTRDEFSLVRDDIKEIKTDVREMRRELTNTK